jgi:hypothetical protein
MLGWHISIFRLKERGPEPPDALAERAELMAVWQSDARGLDWIDPLLRNGQATTISANGYPSLYAVRALSLLPVTSNGPPHANPVWKREPGDVIGPVWLGKTTIRSDVLAQCEPNEWLLVEAWDES